MVKQFQKIAIGCDHAGFPAKAEIVKFLQNQGCIVVDVGCHSEDPCNYPAFALTAAEKVFLKEADGAILICGTGIGMSIAANKVPGCLAALAYNEDVVRFSRQHNNANVLCLGARQFSEEDLIKFVNIWLTTEFEGGRHEQRLGFIKYYEDSK